MDEGIARANDSNFGLTASGWTRSKELAERFRRELDVGVVGINEHGIVAAGEVTASWGGRRESGIGRAKGPFGLYQMVNIKYVFTDDGAGTASAWHYPYDEDFSKFIKASVPMLFRKGFARYETLNDMASTRRFSERVRKVELLKNFKKLI